MLASPGKLMGSGKAGTNLFADASAYWPFASSKSLVGQPGPTLTFTRASTGTYFGSDGLLKTAALNEARFQHTPTGQSLGLLPEESRENKLTWSNDFTNAAWTKLNSPTITPNNGVGPEGLTNMARVQLALADNDNLRQNNAAGTYANSTRIEPSAWVERIGTTGTLRLSNPFGGTLGEWAVDISLLPDGLVRLTRDHAAVTINNEFVSTATGEGGLNFGALAGSVDVNLGYTQLEPGTFSTSHIPTTTAQVVRAADVDSGAIASGTNNTLYVQGRTGYGDGVICQWDNGTETVRYRVDRKSGDIHVVVTNTTVQADLNMGAVADNTDFKLAARLVLNDIAASINGGAIVSDVTATLPSATTIRYGMDSTGIEWNSTIASGALWNTLGKDNDFLQEIST